MYVAAALSSQSNLQATLGEHCTNRLELPIRTIEVRRLKEGHVGQPRAAGSDISDCVAGRAASPGRVLVNFGSAEVVGADDDGMDTRAMEHQSSARHVASGRGEKIGRASCRERVFNWV